MQLRKSTLALAIGAALTATAAYALTQLAVEEPITVSAAAGDALGTGANKAKLFRHRNGMLVTVYGDHVDENLKVYDLKAQAERSARDLFVRTCDSIATSCLEDAHWSVPVNISQSAGLSSIATDWQGTGIPAPFYGDAEKPNGFINPNGVTVVSWVSHYCPGDAQRARLYIERDSRIIPFTCTWVAHSEDYGQTWQPAVQLSTGERAAKQDVNRGTTSFWAVTWQEDPTGLELGEAEGPGDGASGANVSGGTDLWYSWASVSGGASVGAWNPAVRITDNHDGSFGTEGSLPIVFDGTNTPVDDDLIEKGRAGASRSNLGSVGNTVIMAWEETKGSQGLDEGKFVRYLSFNATTPPTGEAGCILSDPTKNARRVRFVTQSPSDAGAGGIQIGIFWKEGITSQGGPSDIMFRRGINGVNPTQMQPAVSPDCAVSDYATTQALFDNGHVRAENLSSRTKDVAASTHDNLLDDTEDQYTENALAHRGLLRGADLWLGYSYTENLALLTYLNMDNYNFWIRKYTWDGAAGTGTWGLPQQVSNITDTEVNLREPRIVGTQPDGDSCATDATECRNADVFYVAWGTQTNVSPWAPEMAENLGLSITRTTDAGATFEPVVNLSVAQGIVFGGALIDDEEGESAFESQLQARPDGNKVYGVWNQDASATVTQAKFTTAEPVDIPDPAPVPVPTSGGGGGCALSTGKTTFDPVLPGVALLALGYLALRRKVPVR